MLPLPRKATSHSPLTLDSAVNVPSSAVQASLTATELVYFFLFTSQLIWKEVLSQYILME